YAQAPVLLAGDIDRGGVFAHLVGTMELLEPEERALVRGFVINKFRGDPALLGDGLDFLERRCGVPTLGVIPSYRDIRLPDEDSVALDAPRTSNGPVTLDIAVLRTPRIANFDDVDALASEQGVGVRFVERVADLGRPDLILLLGSKSTVSDLHFLREQGLAAATVRLAGEGTPVIGICGGFQMLGRVIHDPDGVESPDAETPGLGLLPVETTFARVKRTCRVEGRAIGGRGLLAQAQGAALTGYEIHAGTTALDPARAPFRITERLGAAVDDIDGAVSDDGLVFGSYIHGLFDAPDLRRAVLRELAERKGVSLPLDGPGYSRDAEYDKLADHVRAALDLRRLYAIMGLEGAAVR
ncbi:MAG: cobyric acid synthase, partial [Chloroflexi bacterium]|nr:cobyric acid synthase [Chloroflexota bacterium]